MWQRLETSLSFSCCRRLAACRNRGARSRACRNFSDVLSEHEAGSRSTTARERKGSARKSGESPARRRSKAISGRRRRRCFRRSKAGLLLFSLALSQTPNQARSIKLSLLPESHTLPPNLRFTPPALAARSCSRAACDAWEAGSCSWVVRDAAAARGDRLLFAAAVVLDDTLKEDIENDGVAGLAVEAALDVATPPRAAMRFAMRGPPGAWNARSGGAESAFAGAEFAEMRFVPLESCDVEKRKKTSWL